MDELSASWGNASKEYVMDALEECVNRMNVWKEYCKSYYEETSNEFSLVSEASNDSSLVSRMDKAHISAGLATLMSKNNAADSFQRYDGKVIPFEDLIVEERIGSGGFGQVHSGMWRGIRVAIKKLREQRVSRSLSAQFEGEIKVLYTLNHENIMTFYGACLETSNLCIVMEFMEGSLYDQLHIVERQFHDRHKAFIVREIACGLKYLHSKQIAHADMKSNNVLLNIFDDDIASVKITDFGLSMMKSESETSSSENKLVRYIGTPKYMAPELLRGEFLNRGDMMKADVYAFGLIMF